MSVCHSIRYGLALAALARVACAQSIDVASAGVCQEAGMAAERTHSIPAGMLVAIGRIESGRRHPLTGATVAWPWTINAAGAGRMFDNALQAIETTRYLRARGTASIDVGCYQVNLMHHPSAFASLEAAFDPQANADYAGRFLAQLKEKTGSWEEAVAAYHSATPALGGPYRDRVLSGWLEGGSGLRLMARNRGPVVWAMPVVAFGMRVWTPSTAGGPVTMTGLSSVVSAAQRPLPVVTAGSVTLAAASLPVVHAGLPPGMARSSGAGR